MLKFLFSADKTPDIKLTQGILSVPVSSTNIHKRSSSDAGVSYNVRPNRERRAARRRDFQIIDHKGVMVADGQNKNLESVLVCFR